MNRRQRILLSVFLTLTAAIVLLDNIFPGASMVNCFKFATIAAILLATLSFRKRYREQIILNVAVFFAVVGDFFLNLCSAIPQLAAKAVPFGIAGFFLAYLLLIAVFHRKPGPGWKELLAAVPVLGVFIPNFMVLHSHVDGWLKWGAIVFSFILCFMSWTAIGTTFRGYYGLRSSCFMALAGYMMFVSDMGVANSLFNPAYAGQFVPWLENIIWGTFIPAWTLIAVVIAGEDMFRRG